LSEGAIEQAILLHPQIGEASVVGVPDPLKGHLPFAFIQPRTATGPIPAKPTAELFQEVNGLVREQIGAIASLGGMIQGRGMIPKTRSGKTLRRVLRELVEHAVRGEYEAPVNVPPTVEDADVVDEARRRVREYFDRQGRAKL
jgi:propionyl-CoA synthetase